MLWFGVAYIYICHVNLNYPGLDRCCRVYMPRAQSCVQYEGEIQGIMTNGYSRMSADG